MLMLLSLAACCIPMFCQTAAKALAAAAQHEADKQEQV